MRTIPVLLFLALPLSGCALHPGPDQWEALQHPRQASSPVTTDTTSARAVMLARDGAELRRLERRESTAMLILGLGAATAGGWWYATQNKHIPARYQVPPVILAAAGLAAVTVAEWR